MDYFEKLHSLNEWSMFVGYLESEPELQQDKTALKTAKRVYASGDLTWLTQKWPAVIYKQIKKYRNSKAREVHYYPEPYQTALKLLNHFIMRDPEVVSKFSRSALAYLPNRSIKTSIRGIQRAFQRGDRYYYKTDFTDYFNSINVEILIVKLQDFFTGTTLNFFADLLRRENKGALAGLPLAGLWANVYMNDVDLKMNLNSEVKYYRYADDVLIMSSAREKLAAAQINFLTEIRRLNITLSETKTTNGADEVVFLGFKINKNEVDISAKALAKIKSSMRRRSNWFGYQSDNRRYRNKDYPLYQYLYGLNAKLYSRDSEDGTGWLEWYANTITTLTSLKKLEVYFLKQLTKLYGKKDYEKFVARGYRSLTNEYYRLVFNRPRMSNIA